MKIVFWACLCIVIYTYMGYPVAIWLLSRLRRRPWKTAPICPGVSVVLAVHNGIARLPEKLSHLFALDCPCLCEIIVVSDGSTDGSAELLAEQRHPLLKTILLEEHQGKAVALNAGIAKATAEIILFMDIRPRIAEGAIQQLVRNFADPTVGCVAGQLILHSEGHDAASAAVGSLYWRYEQWIRKCECAFDSPVGVYGGFYAVRRELVVPQPVGMILDDMFQPLSVIRQGYRSVLDPAARVYDTWPEQVRGEFHRKVRTLAGNLQLFRLAPWTLTPKNRVVFQLISHKLLRLVVPWLLILLLVSALVLSPNSRMFAGFAALQVVGWLLATIGLFFRIPVVQRIAAPASALLVLNAAAVIGLYRFLITRGPLWRIWTPAPSVAESPPREKVRSRQFQSGTVAKRTTSSKTL